MVMKMTDAAKGCSTELSLNRALVHKVINRMQDSVEKCLVYRDLAIFFKCCMKFVTQRSEFSQVVPLLMHNSANAAKVVNRHRVVFASR